MNNSKSKKRNLRKFWVFSPEYDPIGKLFGEINEAVDYQDSQMKKVGVRYYLHYTTTRRFNSTKKLIEEERRSNDARTNRINEFLKKAI